MAKIRFDVWENRDNVAEIILQSLGSLVTDLSAITRVVVRAGGVEVDSDVDADAIWWTDSGTRTVSVNGEETAFTGDILKLRLGHSGIPVGKNTGCCLVIFDADANDDGSVWADDMEITVKQICDLDED